MNAQRPWDGFDVIVTDVKQNVQVVNGRDWYTCSFWLLGGGGVGGGGYSIPESVERAHAELHRDGRTAFFARGAEISLTREDITALHYADSQMMLLDALDQMTPAQRLHVLHRYFDENGMPRGEH